MKNATKWGLAIALLSQSFTWAQEIEMDSLPAEQEEVPLDNVPVLQKFVQAEYPATAMRAGIQGAVLLELLVGESGKVEETKVVQPLEPSLDSAALRAVRQFVFAPATAQGQPVAVALQYEYRFSLADVFAIPDQVNFQGTLRERGTRAPIADAMVVLTLSDSNSLKKLPVPMSMYLQKLGTMEGQFVEDGKVVAITDSAGHFSFRGIPAGKITIQFPISGYQLSMEQEVLEPNQQLTMEYALQRESYDNYELVVYGKVEKKEVAKQTLQMQEIRRIPGCGGDAVKVVRALPGVARSTMIDQHIIMRGSGEDDSGFLLDGIRLPYLFHFGGLKSVYQSEYLSSIDVMQGGFGSRYGGIAGGVIEIKGRTAKDDRWHGNVDVNMLDASLSAEGPIADHLSMQVSGRYSYVGPMVEYMTKDLPTVVIPYYWDGLMRLDYTPTVADHFFFTFNASRDRIEIKTSAVSGGSEEAGEATNKGLMDLQYQLGIFGYDRKLSNRLDNSLRVGLVRVEEVEDFFGYADVKLVVHYLDIRDELRFQWTDWVTLGGGPDLEFMRPDYSLQIMSSTGFRGKKVTDNYSRLGGYGYVELKPFKTWTITPSVRYDHYSDVEEDAVSIRSNTRWEYRNGMALKAAAGTYNQAPKPWGQSTDPEWGNPDLGLTTGEQYVVGHEWQMTELINLDVQGYYNHQNHIPRMTDSINPNTGKALNFIGDMEGRMYGMEVFLRHNLGKRFFGWVAYSLSRSERRAPTAYLEGYDFDRKWDADRWNLFEQDQTHNLQVVASWKLPHEWEAGFRMQYTTGNPETPHTGITEDEYTYGGEHGYYIETMGKPLSDRVGPNFRTDIRFDKRFVYRDWMMSVYLDVQNVNYFFYNSPEFYEYNYDYSERKAVGGLILPTLGVTASF